MTSNSADEQPPSAVLIEINGHTMIVTINRPHVRNAINRAVTLGIGEALDRAERDDSVRAVVITGSGDKAFSAGADLNEADAGGSLAAGADPRQIAWGFAGFVRHWIGKPTIAAVNGVALGGGTEIMLACDLAIAAASAKFGLPEVKRGLLAGGGGAFRLPAQIPRKRAMEIILTGEPIGAAEAFALGLVNRVVPATDVLGEALRIADTIAKNAPLAVRASKRLATGGPNGSARTEEQLWDLAERELTALRESEDAHEGAAAFLAKRTPTWLGR